MARAALKSMAGRIGVACYAVWIALALATQGATPCPTHDPIAAAEVAAIAMPAAMPGMTQHASRMSHDARGPHEGHDGAHHGCTCVGCGCCVAMLDLCAPSRALVPAPATLARGSALPLAPRDDATPGADRRLPFANGPPAGVRVPV